MAAEGTPDNPWQLKTPPGQSEYTAYQDETADTPALVVQVGKTELRYHLRALDDLHEMLKQHGDWMPLGSADEQKPAAEGNRRGLGPLRGQPGRRVVWPAQGLPGPLRELRAARAGEARARRGRAQPAQQPDAGDLAQGPWPS